MSIKEEWKEFLLMLIKIIPERYHKVLLHKQFPYFVFGCPIIFLLFFLLLSFAWRGILPRHSCFADCNVFNYRRNLRAAICPVRLKRTIEPCKIYSALALLLGTRLFPTFFLSLSRTLTFLTTAFLAGSLVSLLPAALPEALTFFGPW